MTGRFEAISFEQRYPTGRKHCADCKCWRHLLDFSVRTWLDAAKTIPYQLLSYCRSCVAARQRSRTGYNRRNWFRLGRRGTQAERRARNAERRQQYLDLRKDPVWLSDRRRYQRKRLRIQNHPETDPDFLEIRETQVNTILQYDAKRFYNYINRYLTIEPTDMGTEGYFINGRRVSESDNRALNRWKDGVQKKIGLCKADEFSIEYDLPLWEIDMEAGKMAA